MQKTIVGKNIDKEVYWLEFDENFIVEIHELRKFRSDIRIFVEVYIFLLNNPFHKIVDIIASLTQKKEICDVFVRNGITFDVVIPLGYATN